MGQNFENRKIGHIFVNDATTSSAMDKQRPQLDSAHQIGSEIPWVDVLTVDRQCFTEGRRCPTEFENQKITDVFAHNATTSSAMDKQRQQFHSAHQIGLKTPYVDALTVDGHCFTEGRTCFCK